MTLEGALVAVVATESRAAEAQAEVLRAEGATVRTCTLLTDELATLSEPGLDAAIFDVGSEPERFVALVAGLKEDPHTQTLPIVCLLDDGLPAGRLGSLGAVTAVSKGGALLAAVDAATSFRRTLAENVRRERALDGQIRSALERLSLLGRETHTFAHDARVLHGVIVGFAANLRDGIAGPLEPMQLEHTSKILEAVHDVTTLVDRLAILADTCTHLPEDLGTRRSSIRGPGRRTLEDLESLVVAVVRLLEGAAAKKSTTIEVLAHDRVVLFCDAMQIKQVTTNLVVNALKFSPPGGRITVDIRSMHPASGNGPSARKRGELRVSDHGPGVPHHDRERIFERGVRLERDGAIAGSGIGLAVVKDIVQRHGGEVSVVDSESGGACFVVELPLDLRARHGEAS